MLIERSAVFSRDRKYRYRLERNWRRQGKVIAFFMVNPSDGDDRKDDQTIRKLYGFLLKYGGARFIVGNKFAFCSPRPIDLQFEHDPVGPDNDMHLERIARDAEVHVVAWGSLDKLNPALRDRWRAVYDIIKAAGATPYCLGIAKDGHPLHPLTLSYDRPLEVWEPPKMGAG